MSIDSGGDGQLGFCVWPVYIGLVNAELGTPPFTVVEPSDSPNYQRGQIDWACRDGTVAGRARIICPAGAYTHFAFFHHPTEMRVAGLRKLEHPLYYTDPINTVDVDPIHNDDLALNVPQAPP